MKKELFELIAEQLIANEDDINEESYLADDLGADSYDMVEIVMAIEYDFDINIKNNEIHTLRQVKDILDLIKRKRNE